MSSLPIYNNLRSSGIGNQAAYQVSAKPYLTASVQVPALGVGVAVLEFPNVTSFIVVRNEGSPDLRFGFSSGGVSGDVPTKLNYGTLAQNNSFSGDFKAVRLYLMSDTALEATASVIAGMTGIDKSDLAHNWTGSLGVSP